MPDFSKVEAYLKSLPLPAREAAAYRRHECLYRFSFGEDSARRRYFLYSCTKPVTVVAALRLWERGALALDARVSDYLPAYARAHTLENGAQKFQTMRVRHLFTMTSGLNYNLNAPAIAQAIRRPFASTVDVANAFVEAPLDFAPGERYQYSLSHDALGAVIEAASGKSLAQFMRDEIFEPLGMRRTSFRFRADELMPQYRFENGALSPAPAQNAYIFSDTYFSGGAGLVSTLDDYALFADALASGGCARTGYRLLKDQTVALLRTEQLSQVARDRRFGCAAGPGYGYALGVRTLVDKSFGARSPLGECGWDGAAGAYLLADPENGLSIAFAAHVLGWTALFNHQPLRDLTYEALGM